MPNVGKLYIDTALLTRLLNFPPEHGIVGMGVDPQNGGFLIVSGPTLPMGDGREIPTIALETTFFGGQFQAQGLPDAQQVNPAPPFQY